MGQSDKQVALKVLEDVRKEKFVEVDKDLLAAVYQHEHEHQFEEERGVVRAELRDLLVKHVGPIEP